MNLSGARIANRYEVRDLMSEGGMSYVYRGIDLDTSQAVAVKVLKPSAISLRLEDIVRYQSVSDAISRLDNPHIVRIMETGHVNISYAGHAWYVIMELADGASLSEAMSRIRFSIDNACAVIRQACLALDAVHRLGIIHMDIKPGNILHNAEVDRPLIKITDFGLSRLKRMEDAEQARETSGTYGYMSPEQAGIIRKPVDERSDLYSLGVVWYELLTGELPFHADSVIKMLHELAAKLPEPPSKKNEAVPEVLDAMVMKLLEKDPERRYQSAAGLVHDIDLYLSGTRDFAPGAGDHVDRLKLSPAMVGREVEMNHLKRLLNEAKSGKGKICFISGEAGIGKSRLVDEFRTHVLSCGIPYIDSRAFDRENKNPHEPIRDALAEYLRRYRRYGAAQQEAVRESMHRECGGLGRIITEFYPPLEEVLGRCPDIVPLGPEREMLRFYMVLCKFFFCLAEAERGLVIMLDDLHWSDRGTLRLIEEIARDIQDRPLLILGAFRRREVAADDTLQRLIRSHRDDGIVEEIRLGPLDQANMRMLIQSSVQLGNEDAELLASFLSVRGGGNPLFSQEIMKQLMAEKALIPNSTGWQVDRALLSRVEVPATVIDTLMKRLGSLSAEERSILSRAALIGKVFSMELLMEVESSARRGSSKRREEHMRSAIGVIDRAIKRQIVFTCADGAISFSHDRIRDAFCGKVPVKQRSALHRQIGEALEHMHHDNTDPVIFDLAYHFIESGDEEKILAHAYSAALKARANYSHSDAVRYLNIVRELLKKKMNVDQNSFTQWVECTRNLAKTLSITGSTDTALELFKELIPYMKTNLEKSKIYLLMAFTYTKISDFRSMESYALQGLSLLGEKLPRTKTEVWICIIKEFVIHVTLSFFKLASTANKPKDTKKYRIIIRLYDCLYWKYFFFGKFLKLSGLVLRMVNIAERNIGPSQELAFGMIHYAELLGNIQFFINSAIMRRREIIYSQKTDEILSDIGNNRIIMYLQWSKNFYYLHNTDRDDCIIDAYNHVGMVENFGDVLEMMRAYFIAFWLNYLQANYKDALNYYTICKENTYSEFNKIYFFGLGFPSGYYIDTGDFSKAEEELLKHNSFCSQHDLMQYYFLSCSFLGRLYVEMGEMVKAVHYFNEAKILMGKNYFMPLSVATFYALYAGFLIKDYKDRRHLLSRNEIKTIRKKIRHACFKAVKIRGWFHFGCMAFRETGNYYSMVNNKKKACIYFKQSLDLCRRLGFRYELARTLYDYGVFLRQSGDWQDAWDKLVSAYMTFEEIGITVFRKRIAEQLGLSTEPRAVDESVMSREKMQYMLEKTSKFGVCSRLDDLLDRVLCLAMEISGARNGYILLFDESEDKLVTAASNFVEESAGRDVSWHIVNEVFESGKTLLIMDAEKDERFSQYRSVSGQALKSLICLPLEHREVITGVCYLDNPLASGIFSEGTEQILTMLFSYAVVAIENLLLHELQQDRAGALPEKLTTQDRAYVDRSIRYIDEHCTDDELCREMIADSLGINPDYLGRLFKTRTGKTIRQYMNEARVRRAVDLLGKNEVRIIDVAMDTGFESMRSFYRLFYRVMGQTPAEYREKVIKN